MALQYAEGIPVMGAEHLAELRVAMLFAGIKVQAPADLIGKSLIVVLQNRNVPANSFFALQVVYQRLPYDFVAIRQQIGPLVQYGGDLPHGGAHGIVCLDPFGFGQSLFAQHLICREAGKDVQEGRESASPAPHIGLIHIPVKSFLVLPNDFMAGQRRMAGHIFAKALFVPGQ